MQLFRRVLKFGVVWIGTFVIMITSWSAGGILGNVLTNTAPPVIRDTSVAQAFLAVCLFNSFLLTVLVAGTDRWSGQRKWSSLTLYVFGLQFLLTQMETLFFSNSIGIGAGQVLAIIITGAFMSMITVPAALWISKRMNRTVERVPFAVEIPEFRAIIYSGTILVFLVYPALYLIFGYFVAWQSEELRLFYKGSPEIEPFHTSVVNAIVQGIYFFQLLRAVLWIIISLPVIQMFRRQPIILYMVVPTLTALLPGTLLFIPNPYMPAPIAHIHFIETSISNFLWGLAMVWGSRNWTKYPG